MTKPDGSRLVAIVLNWRDAARTIKCVESLAAMSEVDVVVVVDNESTGELADLSAQLSPSVIDKMELMPVRENRGFAGGMNVAFESQTVLEAEFILALNNDAYLDRLSLNKLLDALRQRPDAGAVGPVVRNLDGSVQSQGAALTRTGLRISQSAGSPDYLTWACVLLRGDALHEVGALDERFFMYWEDYDYGLRLRQQGWELLLVDDASVAHELSASGSSVGDLLRTYYAESLLMFAIKWWRVRGTKPWVHFVAIALSRVARRDGSGLVAIAAAIPGAIRFSRERRVRDEEVPRWASKA